MKGVVGPIKVLFICFSYLAEINIISSETYLKKELTFVRHPV
jgi:hypothetical protein